jgi:hypothetical protein
MLLLLPLLLLYCYSTGIFLLAAHASHTAVIKTYEASATDTLGAVQEM